MTAPWRMVIWGTNDRTTKGVSVGVGNGSDEAGAGPGAWLCVTR